MRKSLLVLMVAAFALVSTGCVDANSKGKCIGIDDKGVPGVEYKLSGWNLAMAIIFCETIVVPIVVIVDDCRCPVE